MELEKWKVTQALNLSLLLFWKQSPEFPSWIIPAWNWLLWHKHFNYSNATRGLVLFLFWSFPYMSLWIMSLNLVYGFLFFQWNLLSWLLYNWKVERKSGKKKKQLKKNEKKVSNNATTNFAQVQLIDIWWQQIRYQHTSLVFFPRRLCRKFRILFAMIVTVIS